MSVNKLAFFSTAFRVFFFACALHAVAAVTLWLLKLLGVSIAGTEQITTYWHTYEMLFGFVRAAIYGFIFTAGQHWTGRFLLGGWSAVLLSAFWLIGRTAFFFTGVTHHILLLVDFAGSLYALYRLSPLVTTKQTQNRQIFFLVAFFSAMQGVLAVFFWVSIPDAYYLPVARIALLSAVLIVAMIAGRILPFFAGNVIQGKRPRMLATVENLVWPATLAVLVAYAVQIFLPQLALGAAVVFLLVAALHLTRWSLWRPLASVRFPILAILFSGYFWLALSFALQAAALSGIMPAIPTASSPAWHMAGIGACGVFIYGMITRVALGHTGRAIKAAPLISVAYVLLNLAVLARVVMPYLTNLTRTYEVAAGFWIAAFVIYLAHFAHILILPRADGRPG